MIVGPIVLHNDKEKPAVKNVKLEVPEQIMASHL